MKKKILLPLAVLSLLALSACNGTSNSTVNNSNNSGESSEEIPNNTSASYMPSVEVPSVSGITEPTNTGSFSLTTKDGNVTVSNNIYTITKAGTYTAKGVLNGQILVQAGDNDDVELSLEGATITYDKDSPIKAVTANEFDVKAKDGTENLVKDLRAHKTADNENVGEGAINSKVDLKLKGSGLLVVVGNYNNAVHTSDDLKIQNLTLQAQGYNNALKGNDSVTITSGTITAIGVNKQGIKTKNSDVSSKGNQRGTITINGGTIYVDAVKDGIEASYNVEINQASDEIPTKVVVKTGSNSLNKSNYKKDNSAKGLKAENKIVINKGEIIIAASDDAVHANYGTALENGSTGLGNIDIKGGTLSIASGDDAIHADNTLTISGGYTAITGATEGLEANHIVITGGETHVYGTDDGVNASKKVNQTPTVEISGGFLDVSVSNGDTDGIDSNGNFTQTGGVVISRGSPGTNASGMSTGLDCDGTASITGGTFIAFNGMEKTPSTGSNVNKASTANATGQGGRPGPGGPGGGRRAYEDDTYLTATSFNAGNYKLSGTGIDISFLNNYQYATFIVYSSGISLNNTYTLSYEGTAVLSWTQSAQTVTIS